MESTDGPNASSSRSPGSRHTLSNFAEETADSLNLDDRPGTQYKTAREPRRQSLMPAFSVDTSATGPVRRKHSGANGQPSSPPYPRRRKAAPPSTHHSKRGPYLVDQDSGFDSGPSTMNAFSDEYDLSHEDPQILQDVQRALTLKARREARMKLETKGPSSSSHPSANTAWLDQSTRPQTQSPKSTTSFPKISKASSEIDFSPSTRSYARVGLHPVPTSMDDGLTLDWSCSQHEDERTDRRWTLSVSKRKGKDRAPPISATALDAQENRYTTRLSRIQTVANPQTLRKRGIIADQLERQYALIYASVSSPNDNFNLLKVSRWHGRQEAIIRSSLEKAEPFTWLRHLDLRGSQGQIRMPWHLTALIMEEYLQAQSRQDRITTIPEDPNSPISSPRVSISPYPPSILPGFPVYSRASSQSALGPSLTRYQSNEGRVSFEPLVESNRDSLEGASHKSGDSTYSSIYHSQPKVLESPASSHLNVLTAPRKYRGSNDSDDGSSAPNSISGYSADEHLKKAVSLNKELLLSSHNSPSSLKYQSVKGDWNSPPASPTAPHLNIKTMSLDGATTKFSTPKVRASPIHSRRSSTTNVARLDRLRAKGSMPGPESSTADLGNRKQQDGEEEKMSREYDVKSRLLRETVAQNSRIRQLLNRIAAGVREYDLTQTSLANLLDVPFNSLPPEVMDAFSHDPSAVTGGTRRLGGWRAVEDIHDRILKQRAIFEDFLSANAHSDGSVVDDSVVQEPLSTLHDALVTLRLQKAAIAIRADEVSESLTSIQKTHKQVKKDYNDALAHTSVVYPEISRIVALEESYKDSYQQFWEMGMDALTFILDSVTPFWRTYGKTIGEDVQDFLIIPLYRHEFTGEAKRYLIESLPKRSLRHWFGLVILFHGTIALVVLQARAAFTSSMHIGLQWIPYDFLRWIALPFFVIGVIVQLCAVLVEFAIVLAQIGVVVWWIGWAIRFFS